MTRGIKKRAWVKLDCQGVLHGSINWLFTLEEQAVFLKLIPMAAIYCKTPGIISDNEGRPLPREFMAYELHCPLDVLERVIEKGTQDNCLQETEDGLQLVNFQHYQFTEYDRQKPYREAKRAAKKAKANNKTIALPDFIDKAVWADYLDMRKKIHKPATPKAQELIITKLSEFHNNGQDANKILRQSIMNSWQGIFPLKEDYGKAKHSRELPKAYTPTDDYPDL